MSTKVKDGGKHTRLSAKNQVTVPVDVLRAVGLGPGDVVDVEAAGPGEIVLRRHESRLEGVLGTIPELNLDIEALRDEWER